MTIYSKAIAWCLIFAAAFGPLSGKAWFFNAAQAQSEADQFNIVESFQNTQTMGLLASAVAMTSDLEPDNGSFVDILDGEALDPDIGSSGTLADVIDDAESATTSVYIVQPGDSVALVARRFGISENTLRFANGMKKTDVLHRGDVLLILPVSGISYTVKSGDTINSIINKYKLEREDVSAFLDYNDLESSSPLHVGDKLIIPGVDLQIATPSSSTKVTAKPSSSSSSSTNVTRGYFIKPISSPSCRLSQGKHDIYAIDLACPPGTPIKAAAAGKVVRVSPGWSGGYGNLVVIQHPNGMITFYAHMLNGSFKVSQGDQVSQGQVIGSVGSTGRSTGPHLHFEVRNGVNPGFDRTGSAWKQ
jgi:murein DD-endopeptidase MepM/ murein hydrolase activator NlpD